MHFENNLQMEKNKLIPYELDFIQTFNKIAHWKYAWILHDNHVLLK